MSDTNIPPSVGSNVHRQAPDPTPNVLDLVEAANKRQDDLRVVSKEVFDTHILYLGKLADLHERFDDKIHAKEEQIANMRELFQEKLFAKEAGLRDSFRKFDTEVGDKAAAAAQQAIATLATVTSTTAEALRNQVASTERALESRRTADIAEVAKRLTALELSSSEGKGKGSVADPALERLVALVENLAKAQQTQGGEEKGVSRTMAVIVSVVTTAATVLGIMTVLDSRSKSAQSPQVVYMPAPAIPAK